MFEKLTKTGKVGTGRKFVISRINIDALWMYSKPSWVEGKRIEIIQAKPKGRRSSF